MSLIKCPNCLTEGLTGNKKCPLCGFEMKTPDKSTLTEEAFALINGPRRDSYGPIEESSKQVAEVWTAYLKPKLKDSIAISPKDYHLMMVLMKAIRESQGPNKDNLVDACAYVILADKVKDLK